MWQKILSIALVVVIIAAAAWYLSHEQKGCCLCSSFRYHAPCLIDLKTGDMVELALYFPHETKTAELADPQPKQETFSLIAFGDVTGYKDTSNEYLEITIPTAETVTKPMLCQECRKHLGSFSGRYILADLYNSKNKEIIPVSEELHLVFRCYEIIAQGEDGFLKVIVHGNIE